MVTLTVPCGGVSISMFVSLTLTILMTLSATAILWHIVTVIVSHMYRFIVFAVTFVTNFLSTAVSEMKEFLMMNPFANMAIVCCGVAFLWRPGGLLPHTEDSLVA